MRSKRWWWPIAWLLLFGAPLMVPDSGAGEAGEGSHDQAPAVPAETPAEERPEPASEQKPDPPEERVSADNNLSFPVDI